MILDDAGIEEVRARLAASAYDFTWLDARDLMDTVAALQLEATRNGIEGQLITGAQLLGTISPAWVEEKGEGDE